MKRIVIDPNNQQQMQQNTNEINILRQLKHRNLIEYYDSFVHKGKFCIIMEYADGGDLSEKIKHSAETGKPIPENDIWHIFLELCNALKYIHSKRVIHRDIKSQNIFLTKSGHVKLGDFGISKLLNNGDDFTNTSIGTPYFLSPEICMGKSYNQKSDIWMLGCVLFELCCLKKPFNGVNLPILMKNIVHQPVPKIPSFYSSELRQLINLLLDKNMETRPSIKDILNISYVKDKILSFKPKLVKLNSTKEPDTRLFYEFSNNSEESDEGMSGSGSTTLNEKNETEEDVLNSASSPKVRPSELLRHCGEVNSYHSHKHVKSFSRNYHKRNSFGSLEREHLGTDTSNRKNKIFQPKTPNNFTGFLFEKQIKYIENNKDEDSSKKDPKVGIGERKNHIKHAKSSMITGPKSNTFRDYNYERAKSKNKSKAITVEIIENSMIQSQEN